MTTNREKEEQFFQALIYETPIEICIRLCAKDLASLHYASTGNLKNGVIPENDEQSVSRHFIDFIKNLHHFKRELLNLNYSQVPTRLFVKFGPAVEWMLKDVRRYLDLDNPCDDPIEDVHEAFQRVKDICRSESQPEEIDGSLFRKMVGERMDAFIEATRRLGKVTRSVEERRVIEHERQTGQKEEAGHFLAQGKGVSHFDRIGIEYKGVSVPDPSHLVLFGRASIEITAQSTWSLVDRMLVKHFNDEPFEFRGKDFAILTTPDERRLIEFIHRETLEEVGRRRHGNGKYTGRAWFKDKKAA